MTLRKKIIDLLSRNPIPFTPMEVFCKLDNEYDFMAVGEELHNLEKEGRLKVEWRHREGLYGFFTYRNDGAA